jgi:hypothetical protein
VPVSVRATVLSAPGARPERVGTTEAAAGHDLEFVDGEPDLDALDDLAAGRALRTLLIDERTDHGDQR